MKESTIYHEQIIKILKTGSNAVCAGPYLPSLTLMPATVPIKL